MGQVLMPLPALVAELLPIFGLVSIDQSNGSLSGSVIRMLSCDVDVGTFVA